MTTTATRHPFTVVRPTRPGPLVGQVVRLHPGLTGGVGVIAGGYAVITDDRNGWVHLTGYVKDCADHPAAGQDVTAHKRADQLHEVVAEWLPCAWRVRPCTDVDCLALRGCWTITHNPIASRSLVLGESDLLHFPSVSEAAAEVATRHVEHMRRTAAPTR